MKVLFFDSRGISIDRILIACALFLLLFHIAAQSAFARDKDKDVPVAGLSGGLIAICPPFGGGFQVGYWGACLIFGDPPDTVNACAPVDLNDYLVHEFPDVLTLSPTVDPDLATVMDAAMDDVDLLLALSRALRATTDRHEGAIILGNLGCASDRLAEMLSLNQQLEAAGKQSHISLDAYVSAQNSNDPSVLSAIVTKQQIKDLRDQIAAGLFPEVDSVAMSAWALTAEEIAFMQEVADSTSDSDIDDVFAAWSPKSGDEVTMGFLMDVVGDEVCEECLDPDVVVMGQIPTLSEWAMIIFAVVIMALMTYVVVRRRRNIRPTTA